MKKLIANIKKHPMNIFPMTSIIGGMLCLVNFIIAAFFPFPTSINIIFTGLLIYLALVVLAAGVSYILDLIKNEN